jgi:hypothetical protein
MTLFTKKTIELSTVLFVAMSDFFWGTKKIGNVLDFFSVSSVNSTNFAISGKKIRQIFNITKLKK